MASEIWLAGAGDLQGSGATACFGGVDICVGAEPPDRPAIADLRLYRGRLGGALQLVFADEGDLLKGEDRLRAHEAVRLAAGQSRARAASTAFTSTLRTQSISGQPPFR